MARLVTDISQVAEALKRGELAAFPTETVYGLGARIDSVAAIAKIFAYKGRPSSNPLIVHIADEQMLDRVVSNWPDIAQRCAQAFWPGPLSIVVPAHPELPRAITAGLDTVAVRLPAHEMARDLIRAVGLPLAAPSANISEQLSPTRAEHVLEAFNERELLVLDGGICVEGLESSVVYPDIAANRLFLLRRGSITPEEMTAATGVRCELAHKGKVMCPGQLQRHYCPHTPLAIVSAQWKFNQLQQELSASLITDAVEFELGPDSSQAARDLYARLRELDALGKSLILVRRERYMWGGLWDSIWDRLERAATYRFIK